MKKNQENILADSKDELADKPRSVIEHLEELRSRIFFSLFLVIICSALVYSFIPQVMNFIIKPVGKLYFMSPAEAFWVQVKLAFFLGLYCALPFVFYQAWKFVEVGLKRNERCLIFPLALASFILFTLGAGFCYFLVVPVAVRFLLSYGLETLVPLISVSRYLSFIGSLIFSFGITFQLPLAIMVLARIGLINSKILRQMRRFAVLAGFIVGAALTPTVDMLNQTLLALPIIVLYELSIWLVKILEKTALHQAKKGN
ncbi:MAG: twin-arginine translocase subunit TatC [Candidatus Omnitrophica bacterium]|nr:twin-arginine translocase subunit TatC [Candidatus Omnitrophota bacterium]